MITAMGTSRRGYLKAGAGLLYGSLLAALDGGSVHAQTGSAQGTLEFWTDQVPGSGGWAGYERALALVQEQHPELKVTMLPSLPARDTQFIAQTVAGVGPDVLHVWDPNINRFAGNQLLLDLTDFVNRDTDDVQPPSFYPRTFDAMRVAGGLTAIPTWLATSGLFFNKSLFTQLGVPVPNETWTWDTLLQYGPRFTEQGGDGNVTRWLYGSDSFSFTWSTGPIMWVWAAGGDVFDNSKNSLHLE